MRKVDSIWRVIVCVLFVRALVAEAQTTKQLMQNEIGFRIDKSANDDEMESI